MNGLMVIPALAWLTLSTIFFAIGEYMSKKWGMNPSWLFAIEIGLVYGFGSMLWLPALLHKNQLAVVGTFYALMSVVTTIAIGIFVFREAITVTQSIGLLLAFIALGLLWI